MKKRIGYLICTLVLITGTIVKADNETVEDTLTQEEETALLSGTTIDIQGSGENKFSLKEQREILHQEKQEIKSTILNLYKDIKKEHNKDIKKDIKIMISKLKKELRVINTKIAYSYRDYIAKLFLLKK